MSKSPTLSGLLNELNRLYDCPSAADLPATVQQVLANTIPCDVVGWFDVTEQITVRSYDHWLDNLAKEFPDFTELVDEIFLLHPFTTYFLSDRPNRVLRLSDFKGSNEWFQHPLFKPISDCYQARFLLGARIIRPGDGFIALAIGRNSKEFSGEEMTRVEEVLQHIDRHATALGLIPSEKKLGTASDFSAEQEKLTATFGLTAREAEAAYWAAQGKTNQSIATILGISPHTVRTHLQHVFEKVNVETRAALAHMVWSL